MKQADQDRMRTATAVIFAVAIFISGCGGGGGGSSGGGSAVIVFPADYKTTYTFVRDCRVSTDHAGLGGVKVYSNPESAAAYAALWNAPNIATSLPEGTTLVKEVYADSSCSGLMTQWVAMKKEAGFDPAHNNWHWQSVGLDRTILSGEDGIVDRCINCHNGTQGSCTGLGANNGYDYTCTVHLSTDP